MRTAPLQKAPVGPLNVLTLLTTRFKGKDYLQQAVVPLDSETHGGTDVAAYATGPRSYLVRGVIEQNYLFQVMNYVLNLTGRAQQGEDSGN